MQDVGEVVPNLNLRRRRKMGDIILPLLAGLVSALGLSSVCGRVPAGGPPWASKSQFWESHRPRPTRDKWASGKTIGASLWVQRLTGQGRPSALCIVNLPIVKTVINCFPQREESSLYRCTGIQPLPVQKRVQSGPVQLLCPNLLDSGWPGALGVARLLH